MAKVRTNPLAKAKDNAKAVAEDPKAKVKKGKGKAAAKPTRAEIRAQAAAKKEAKRKELESRVCISQDPAAVAKEIHKDWDKKVPEKKWPGLQALVKGCTKKPKTPRAKWCPHCYKIIRRTQLHYNNIWWKGRVKEGTAGHHTKYRGKPTKIVKKLEKVGVKPDQVINKRPVILQGGDGVDASLPAKIKSLVAKVSDTEIAKPKKAPEPKRPKPDKQHKAVAKRARESIKKQKEAKAAKGPEAPQRPEPPKAPDVNAQLAAVAKEHNKIVGHDKAPTAKKAPAAKKAAAKTAQLSLVEGVTGKPAEGQRLRLQKGELYADQAKDGVWYDVAGVKAKLFSKTPGGKVIFESADDSSQKITLKDSDVIEHR